MTDAARRGWLGDPAVRWLAAARVVQLAAAPLTLWLALTRLTDAQRAFYGIAVNLALLGTAVETGPATLVVQLAARDPGARGALRAAARAWYARAAGILAVLVGVVGGALLVPRAQLLPESFLGPWLVLTAAVAGYVLLVPDVALEEGRGGTVAVQRMRAMQAVAVAVATTSALLAHRAVWAGALAACAALAVAAQFVARRRGGMGTDGPSASSPPASYPLEQRRTAAVWIALWATPQLLTPMTVILRSANVAGPLAVALAVTLAPMVLAVAWLHGRYAAFGALAAAGRIAEFDRATGESVRHALAVFGIASAAVLAIPTLLGLVAPHLALLVLDARGLVALLVGHAALLLMQAMLAWARAFGEESLATSAIGACLAAVIGAAVGAMALGAMGAATGYGLGAAVGVLAMLPPFRALRRDRQLSA